MQKSSYWALSIAKSWPEKYTHTNKFIYIDTLYAHLSLIIHRFHIAKLTDSKIYLYPSNQYSRIYIIIQEHVCSGKIFESSGVRALPLGGHIKLVQCFLYRKQVSCSLFCASYYAFLYCLLVILLLKMTPCEVLKQFPKLKKSRMPTRGRKLMLDKLHSVLNPQQYWP